MNTIHRSANRLARLEGGAYGVILLALVIIGLVLWP